MATFLFVCVQFHFTINQIKNNCGLANPFYRQDVDYVV